MEAYKGKVKKFKAVTRNRVQIFLEQQSDLFELWIDQSWALNIGDELIIAGARDESGKICCYAYANKSIGVTGWNNPAEDYDNSLIWISITICIFAIAAVLGVALLYIFGIASLVILCMHRSNNKRIKNTNGAYTKARQLVTDSA